MGGYITLATCQLNQWAMDFEGNTDRIIKSIKIAKARGATFRTGPELEITGYGCLDHFLENDTYLHSWEMLARILSDPDCQDILLDIGMPVRHHSVYYNCRVIVYNKYIHLIRPKLWLANDGNYRERRYFQCWREERYWEMHDIPQAVWHLLDSKQRTTVIGDVLMRTNDAVLGFETCEELWTPFPPHVRMGLDGCEIFTNSSGSHHELRKLDQRLSLIQKATHTGGGVYLYANQQGCDGDRLYYDGSSLIASNGNVLAQGSQFALSEVEVVTATVDLQEVRGQRASFNSRSAQAANSPRYHRVVIDINLSCESGDCIDTNLKPTHPITPRFHKPQEEIALGPACWLWDYLRRSGQAGFFLALSGGLDSCSVATIVFSMCQLVVKRVAEGDKQVLADARRIVGDRESCYTPADPKEFCGRIFHTTFMGTENSSADTRGRAKELSEAIGSYHIDLNMDTVVTSIQTLFTLVTNKTPSFKVHGGSGAENLALQNIQARLRMLLSYLFAQLLPWVRGRTGALLVLGAANVDEALRGYFTKYDCSSSDIAPIGGISKTDLKMFLEHAEKAFDLPVLAKFIAATPTAELEPITKYYVQSDEVDMGMTYQELSVFGRLRKVSRCGPFSMFEKLLHDWSDILRPSEIAKKVEDFFYYYSINRHKMTTLTPSYHAEAYSPDDNRFDLRQFLYNKNWTWQFRKIDKLADELEKKEQ